MTAGKKAPRGFTLPLTLALAFAIMSIAAGLTGLVVVRAKEARQRDADVFALITLESAVQASLVRLEKDGAPQSPAWSDTETLNNRRVALTFQAVGYKPDVRQDPPEAIAASLTTPALKGRALEAMADPEAESGRAAFARFGDFLGATGATPSEEDCLRTRLTFGRQGPQPDPLPPPTALPPELLPLAPGDVVEVRAQLRSDRYTDVLWQRLRYSGEPGRPWRIHDWRRLRLAPDAVPCRSPSAAP